MTATHLKNAAKSAREPLVVCLLVLPATSPLWKSTLPRTFDGLYHLFRVLEVDHLLRQGLLFSRWAPDLFYGYGYPVFDFVPPLPYYLAETLRLTGLSLVHTVLLCFNLALLASSLTMYFFVRDVFGQKAAVLSAVAYVYAPFHLYDVLFRGHLPGILASALFPLVLWSFRRLTHRGGFPYLVSSTVAYAASLLTHNPASLIFTPVLGLYLLTLILTRKEDRLVAGARVATALLIGAGLAAFFWIPALWDRQWIQLDRMITPPDLDFHTHFISADELLSTSPAADTGLMNPGLPNHIGPVFVALSLVSAASLWRSSSLHQTVHLVIAVLIVAGAVFMTLPQSTFLWENLPLLEYLTYPHRFLRLVSFGIAILCGAVTRLFADDRRRLSPRFLVTTVSIVMVVFSTLSLLYPPYYRQLPPNPSFVEMMEFERRTGAIGTTSHGEYLPVWVEWVASTSPLEPMYHSPTTVERLDYSSLPNGTHISEARYTPTSMTVRTSARRSFQATFNCLYFPGWRAYLDGHETEITPTRGQGLISVSVPAGDHVVHVRFESMPARAVSEFITGLSILFLILLSASLRFRPSVLESLNSLFQRANDPFPYPEATAQMGSWEVSILGIVAVVLLVLKTGYVDTRDTWFKREFDGVHVATAQKSLQVNFADQVTLLAYDLAPSTPHAGDILSLNLYWKARQTLTVDYSAFAHLVDDKMNIYAQEDSLNPGRYPTHYWQLDEYNKDPHQITIPPGTPPGHYLLGVGLYDPLTLKRLPVLDEGSHRDGMLLVEEIAVLKGDRPPDVDALGIQIRTDVDFENGMTLLGHSAQLPCLIPGDFYRLALFWQARTQLEDDYVVSLRLIDQEGRESLLHSSAPSAGRYPTDRWEEGEIVRDNHGLWIKPGFPSGQYALQLSLLGPQGERVAIEAGDEDRAVGNWLGLRTVQGGH